MINTRKSAGRRLALATIGLAVAAATSASPLEVRKNDVIPVRFDGQLSTSANSPGDTFTATPERDDVFPRGTSFEGHIVRVNRKTDRHAASMDLKFDDVKMPDGTRKDIVGVPVPLTSKYVERDRDGRYVAKAAVRKDSAIGIGALAGLVVGAILHKPFEGAFVGTLAGILVASTAGEDNVLVINRGSEAGVLFQRTVRFDDVSADARRHEESGTAESSAPLTVKIADRTVQYSPDLAPFHAGSTLMVPIQVTAKQLGLSYDESESSIFVESDAHSLRFEAGSASYRIDGRSETLPASLIRRDGVWYGPATAFGAALGS